MTLQLIIRRRTLVILALIQLAVVLFAWVTRQFDQATRNRVGHEPLFFPGGTFTPGSCVIPACDGPVYDHPVPAYISYTSGQPVAISLRVSVQGSNAIWRGGWVSNTNSDTVFVEISGSERGGIGRKGKLITAEGVYY
jgi:hypothetical protein